MATGTRPTGATMRPVARAGTPERRSCPACGERLSAYNPGPHCYAHTIGVPWKGPNQRG
jgi:hypothetical protein